MLVVDLKSLPADTVAPSSSVTGIGPIENVVENGWSGTFLLCSPLPLKFFTARLNGGEAEPATVASVGALYSSLSRSLVCAYDRERLSFTSTSALASRNFSSCLRMVPPALAYAWYSPFRRHTMVSPRVLASGPALPSDLS